MFFELIIHRTSVSLSLILPVSVYLSVCLSVCMYVGYERLLYEVFDGRRSISYPV